MNFAHFVYPNWIMNNWNTTVSGFSQTSARNFQLTVVFLGMSISGFASFVLISDGNFGSHDTCPFCLWPSYTCCCSSRAPTTSTYLANVHQFTFCCWLFTIFYGVPYMPVDVSYVLIVIERYMAICHPSAHQQLNNK